MVNHFNAKWIISMFNCSINIQNVRNMVSTVTANRNSFVNYLCCFMLLVPVLTQAHGQAYSLTEYKLSTYFVNDFQVSPDGKYMVFNTISLKNGQLESAFFLKDLVRGATKSLGEKDAFIQGWIDNKHIVFGNGTSEYTVQNVFTLSTNTISSNFSMYDEPLLISPQQMITCEIDMDKTTYNIYKDNKLVKTLVNKRFLDMNFFDVMSNSILEITPKHADNFSELDIYQFSYETDTRKKIATIPSTNNSVIQEVSLRNNKIYYLEQVQTYTQLEEHLWDKVIVKLCTYDMTTNKQSVIHTFDEGMECLNLEIIGNDKFAVLLKNHKNDKEEIVDEPVNNDGMNLGFDFGSKLMILEKIKAQEK